MAASAENIQQGEHTDRPEPRLAPRGVDRRLELRATDYGLKAIAARVLASRGLEEDLDLDSFLEPRLSVLDTPSTLADIDVASQRLASAIMSGELIALQTDYDTDGLGAQAALYTVIRDVFGHPDERIQSFVGNRLTEGYGLTDLLVDRILTVTPRPTLLITADNGSSDGDRIARLVANGIEVCVTDHHLIPDTGPPASALACINPQRLDCSYPDKFVAGGMVAWLLLASTNKELIDCGYIDDSSRSRLRDVLDYVACSTVADCVSLASKNNRAVVRYGLKQIAAGARPCWSAMRQFMGEGRVTAESIAFQIAPRIHSRTRLSEPMAALHYLLAESNNVAKEWVLKLDQTNQERRQIERTILDAATIEATKRIGDGHFTVTLLLEDAHPGVQGICASRIVETYGRPALLFAPDVGDPDRLTGSARAIEGFHIREALQAVSDRHPGLIDHFGGHRAAAGIRLRRESFLTFQAALEEVAREVLDEGDLGPVIWHDGELSPEEMSLETVDVLASLEPFGRGFEPPIFVGQFEVLKARPIGDGTHLKMTVRAQKRVLEAVWFRARSDEAAPFPLEAGVIAELTYEVKDNVFRGQRTLQLVVRHARRN